MSTSSTPGSPARWEHLSQSTLATTRVLDLRSVRLRHPQRAVERDFVVIASADWCNVIAVTPDGKLVLVRQFRFGIEEFSLEIPGGIIDPGETPVAAAVRELREETGYSARSWTHLALTHPGIGYSDERIEYYLARDLQRGESRLDEGEFLQVFSLPFATAVQWVLQGRITDTKTMIGLLLAEKYLQGQWTVNPAQGQQP
jgi:8-oxo-dGTP pyrophosphatase MutT (NUDIX family)